MGSTFTPGSYVVNNLNAMNTQRYLNGMNNMLSRSLSRLSSGYRINVAADDPSGLQISEQLRSQNSGMNRAIQNTQEASNVIGIAEGAMIEINNLLTKMRQLAIHAANEGATSPEQLTADQSEMDSGIQTIDRIASTTRFSDQFLLNGSKSLIFRTKTTVNDSMDNKLVDVTKSRVDQVSKRGNEAPLSINFTGYNNSQPGMQAMGDRQARRAVIEADKTIAGNNSISGWVPDIIDGHISQQQRFILTGNAGSRSFAFLDGTHLGVIANSIDAVKGSTGIGATLTFDSAVTGSQVDLNTMPSATPAQLGDRSTGQTAIYNPINRGAGMVDSIEIDPTGANYHQYALVPGMNLDADGRMYLQWTGTDTYIAYKDQAMTMEIGRGKANAIMTSSNNSGVASAYIRVGTSAAMAAGDQTVLQFGQQFELHDPNAVPPTDYNMNGMNAAQMRPLLTNFGLDLTSGASCLSGVRLQDNTSDDARLYFKMQYDDTTQIATMKIFMDGAMLPEHLVAEGTQSVTGANTPFQISIQQVNYNGNPSGIFSTLAFSGMSSITTPQEGAGTLEFNQLGLRIYSEDYGAAQYIRVQNLEGSLLGGYDAVDSLDLHSVAIGETLQASGGDALLAVNGQVVFSQGLKANISSQNYSGSLTFNNGELGMTTIAQVGQNLGALASRGGSLQTVPLKPGEDPFDPTSQGYLTWATNARHNTSEQIEQFIGGMQYQLGESENDAERTIYSIPAMTVANLGKCEVAKGKMYSMQDVLSGGAAALANDPIAAMKIIRQAIDDVASTRARLGAFQKDMLMTNANSMEVTVENIAKTESYIRDTDMASESTEFTKNQILVNAGTSMLAQANRIPQSVLSLLGS